MNQMIEAIEELKKDKENVKGLEPFRDIVIRTELFVNMKKQFIDNLIFWSTYNHLLKKMIKKLKLILEIVKKECRLENSEIKTMTKNYS